MVKDKIQFGSTEVEMLLEDLGLIPSSFITPEVLSLIEQQFRMREFDMPDYEKMYCELYLDKLRKKREFERKRVKPTIETTLKINF